jgi:hypothetical protein
MKLPEAATVASRGQGKAVAARRGKAWRGGARRGKAVLAGLGMAWRGGHGAAWQGMAGQGGRVVIWLVAASLALNFN